ncbi:DUF1120 domain-containing protein [Serratia sp. UGAL515B_01]|uniref:DUF1120 domain-containing protein n=1 Tax=Serratia sp. UGAL515B_01 TaxID=2986763 RepID=UPI0029531860|nr:DUF1120 domain-containing protein [Serratia sp. UGAL515B_01]WON77968.1 DUF1120 domain-containing protein [Serratia sp. UGAL515B_01]
MKKIIWITALVVCSTQAMAASLTLNVHGIISPPACVADVEGGADLDWGVIHHTELGSNYTTLEAKPVTLSINCPADANTHVAFWVVDGVTEKAMSGTNTNGMTNHADINRDFSIGTDPNTSNPIGNYTLNPVEESIDGNPQTSFGFAGGGSHSTTSFLHVKMSQFAYDKIEDWTFWDDKKNMPAVGNSFKMKFNVEPQINKISNLSVVNQINWKGTAQFNIRYF